MGEIKNWREGISAPSHFSFTMSDLGRSSRWSFASSASSSLPIRSQPIPSSFSSSRPSSSSNSSTHHPPRSEPDTPDPFKNKAQLKSRSYVGSSSAEAKKQHEEDDKEEPASTPFSSSSSSEMLRANVHVDWMDMRWNDPSIDQLSLSCTVFVAAVSPTHMIVLYYDSNPSKIIQMKTLPLPDTFKGQHGYSIKTSLVKGDITSDDLTLYRTGKDARDDQTDNNNNHFRCVLPVNPSPHSVIDDAETYYTSQLRLSSSSSDLIPTTAEAIFEGQEGNPSQEALRLSVGEAERAVEPKEDEEEENVGDVQENQSEDDDKKQGKKEPMRTEIDVKVQKQEEEQQNVDAMNQRTSRRRQIEPTGGAREGNTNTEQEEKGEAKEEAEKKQRLIKRKQEQPHQHEEEDAKRQKHNSQNDSDSNEDEEFSRPVDSDGEEYDESDFTNATTNVQHAVKTHLDHLLPSKFKFVDTLEEIMMILYVQLHPSEASPNRAKKAYRDIQAIIQNFNDSNESDEKEVSAVSVSKQKKLESKQRKLEAKQTELEKALTLTDIPDPTIMQAGEPLQLKCDLTVLVRSISDAATFQINDSQSDASTVVDLLQQEIKTVQRQQNLMYYVMGKAMCSSHADYLKSVKTYPESFGQWLSRNKLAGSYEHRQAYRVAQFFDYFHGSVKDEATRVRLLLADVTFTDWTQFWFNKNQGRAALQLVRAECGCPEEPNFKSMFQRGEAQLGSKKRRR
jgi:hypothetical protein